MNISDYLSDDGQAMLLLCSQLGVDDAPLAPVPFKLAEWNQLAKKIAASPFRSPAGLFGPSPSELAAGLGVEADEGARVAGLLERSGRVAMLLENLFSRGIWAITRMDARYPTNLRDTLKHQAPTVLFGAGDVSLLRQPGLAVIGSRTLDQAGIDFARELGRKAAGAKTPIVSGGARGTDRLAMEGALQAGGKVFGVMADSLERTIRQPDVRQFLLDGNLVMLTPFGPDAGFSVGAAMGRNKIIYGLASHAVVVSSDFDKGGTWAGATEALKAKWCPVFVRADPQAPKGNHELIKRGGIALKDQSLAQVDDPRAWLESLVVPQAQEQDLFGGR